MEHEGFTPGPWQTWDDGIRAANGETIAQVFAVDADQNKRNGCGQSDHNADLIAAAPALLAENERLRERLANLALESTHFLDNGIGRIHLRESIERANFALAGGRGEK